MSSVFETFGDAPKNNFHKISRIEAQITQTQAELQQLRSQLPLTIDIDMTLETNMELV